MPIYQFYREQQLNATPEKVWDFISSPKNLQKITPPQVGFRITSGELPEKMYAGMIICYAMRPVPGIRVTWVTEITHVDHLHFFVDEQRAGPFKMWHHEHRLIANEQGTLMTDLITYQPPLGFIGAIGNRLIIQNQMKTAFDFRRKVMDDLFN